MGKSWVGCRQPDITTYQVMRSMDLGEAYKDGGYGIFSRGDRIRGRFIYNVLLKLPLRSFTTAKAARHTRVKVEGFCPPLHCGSFSFFFFYNNNYY